MCESHNERNLERIYAVPFPPSFFCHAFDNPLWVNFHNIIFHFFGDITVGPQIIDRLNFYITYKNMVKTAVGRFLSDILFASSYTIFFLSINSVNFQLNPHWIYIIISTPRMAWQQRSAEWWKEKDKIKIIVTIMRHCVSRNTGKWLCVYKEWEREM